MEKLIDKIFRYEDEEPLHQLTFEQSQARDKFYQTLEEMPEGFCRLGILWKDNEPDVCNNYDEAKRIFDRRECQESSLDPKFKEDFDNAIEEWETKSSPIIREVVDKTLIHDIPGFFIPTFGIRGNEKTTTKTRLIVISHSQ